MNRRRLISWIARGAGSGAALVAAACGGKASRSRTPFAANRRDLLRLLRKSDDGRFLILSNTTAWLVEPDARGISSAWRSGEPIAFRRDPASASYPFVLANLQRQEAVPARLGKRLD